MRSFRERTKNSQCSHIILISRATGRASHAAMRERGVREEFGLELPTGTCLGPCLVAASSLHCLKACAVVRPQVLMSCELLVNLLEDGRSIFEIRTIGQLCLEAKAESLARGTRKEGPEAPSTLFSLPSLIFYAGYLPHWRRGDGLESLAAGGCALLVADAFEASRALAADRR